MASTTPAGGGPRLVVSTAAFHARVRGSVPGLSGLKETKNVSSPSTCENQYCEEPQWPRGSVLGLRPPGLEFRILCLEDSVISIISPSSGRSPGPVQPICTQRWPEARFISFPQHQCRILTSLSLGGSYPRLLGREKLWTTALFPYLGAGRTQLQPMRSWYFSRTSDVP